MNSRQSSFMNKQTKGNGNGETPLLHSNEMRGRRPEELMLRFQNEKEIYLSFLSTRETLMLQMPYGRSRCRLQTKTIRFMDSAQSFFFDLV